MAQEEKKNWLSTQPCAAGKGATALVVENGLPQGHVFPATATHFGGNPYFETGDTWPVLAKDGRPYDFVCQVNLSDCPERPNFPFGLFTVFLSLGGHERRRR